MSKKRLISIKITLSKFQSFVDRIVTFAKTNKSSYVCVANVHMCIEALKDEGFAQIVNHADIITPDGKPLVFALKWLYGIEQEKVSGPDLMPILLKEAEKQNLKVFYYGSTPNVLDKLVQYTHTNYPLLQIAGSISPPFGELSYEEEQRDIAEINNSGANMVFVALGCPKQERWMARNKGQINAVMLGVGGAFPMLVGIEKRAPRWMQENGFEWLFRLIQDPLRLFKRYFITNSIFIYLLIKEKVKISFNIKTTPA